MDMFKLQIKFTFWKISTLLFCSNNKNCLQTLLKKKLVFNIKLYKILFISFQVVSDLPGKSEILLYTPMSAEQKKLYKAVLTNDVGMYNNISDSLNFFKKVLFVINLII